MRYRTTLALLVCLSFLGCDQFTKSSTPKYIPANATESVKAGVGVGQKGRSLDDQSDVQLMVSYPAVKFFEAKERIAFEIQIPHAVNLFRASEGRFPKTHEEFMTKIVQANQIVLPELPPGRTYRFDSEKGELWVDPPKKASEKPDAQSGGKSANP
jgi:hypothetical protein